MRVFIPVILLILSLSISAREFGLVQDIHKEYDNLYRTLGDDNNSIDSEYFSHNDLAKIRKAAEKYSYGEKVIVKKSGNSRN